MTMRKVSLTGIKPTGDPHIGNYVGSIKPALDLAKKFDARYFIADYHALNQIKDPKLLKDYIYEIAAAWLACGLNPDEVLFYRQSDVPETFDLATILMASTPKGLLNRAHAYKAMIQTNQAEGKDQDIGVNMGLYTYPVLMSADILLFDTNFVPVGKDQFQHIEMAADIAQALNYAYKDDVLVIPEPYSTPSTQTVIGLDGRKMSKSYNNTIPMFLPEKKLRKRIMKIVTNSQVIEEPKDPETCSVFTLYKLFASEEQIEALKQRYLAGGMGWGDAKQELFLVLNEHLSPYREKYDVLIQDRPYIDKLLKEGSEKARTIAGETIRRVRKAIGIG
ncbi:MAG: tryptophan--tRNA ligase [Candidatus Zophobacter franzmannii]|nr:tryptophan--tRNA ligase [Candidatus Zophobacter franzmannii]